MRHRVALMVAAMAALLAAACTSGGQTSAGSRQPASASAPAANGCAGQPPVSHTDQLSLRYAASPGS